MPMRAYTYLLGCLVTTVLLCCSGGARNEEEAFDSTEYLLPVSEPITREMVTRTGKKWLVHQTPLSDPTYVNVSVESKGFDHDQSPIDLGEIDPVVQVKLADLDKDGFEELYLATQSAGPEAFGTMYGFYSDQDRDVLLVSYEGASPYTMKEGGPYEGYQGGDSFLFGENSLVNSFQVKLPQSSSVVKRALRYKLVREEGSIVLRPDRWATE